jgi:hypothetical protein
MIRWIRAIAIVLAMVALLVVAPSLLIDPLAGVFVLIGIVAAFLLAFHPFRELYGGTLGSALMRHIGNSITLFNRFQIIRDGQSMLPTTDRDVLGPHLVIINPGSAVVMEQGGRQTRVSGPGIFWSGFFEFARKAYNLRCQQDIIRSNSVLTNDLIPTTITLCVSYRLSMRPEVSTGEDPLNEVEEQIIKHIDLNMPDWEQETKSTVQGVARQAASQWSLGELMTAANTAAVERQIVRESNRRLNPRGILVEQIVVENIQPQSEIISAAADRWISASVEQAIENVNSQIYTRWQDATTKSYMAAQAQGIEPESIQQDAFIRVLREFVKNVSINITTPERQGRGPFTPGRN